MEGHKEKRERDVCMLEKEDQEEPLLKKPCSSSFVNTNILQDVNVYQIPVNGKYTDQYGTFAICSYIDYDRISKYNWSWDKNGYAKAGVTNCGIRKCVTMSRLVMEPDKSVVVDHINRIRSDNRRENLRLLTRSQNNQNKSKKQNCTSTYHGVSYYSKLQKFVARVRFDGKNHNLGCFESEIEAATVYDRFVIQNGLFHSINFVEKVDSYKTTPLVKPRFKSKGFKYVRKWGDYFYPRFTLNGVSIKLGSYKNIEDAARAADKYIVENKLDRPLNFPEEYPDFSPDLKQKSFFIEIDLNDKNICDIIKSIGQYSPIDDIDPSRDVLMKINGDKKLYTLIERSDFDKIKYGCISMGGNYVRVSKKSTKYQLSRHIFGDVVKSGDVVDHISSNVLDNRKRFLKISTVADNSRNKRKSDVSKTNYIGVSYSYGSWRVQLMFNGKFVLNKCIDSEVNGARFRDLFIMFHYPDKYRLNFNDWNDETIEEWKTKLQNYITWS
jgi:hypothetical protein